MDETVKNLDQELADADWTKKTWDLPLDREEFEAWWQRSGMSAAHLRSLPCYLARDRPAWVDAIIDGEEFLPTRGEAEG